ncbi:MAG: DUF998 domain-containing protein [Promethearchaeota archaeon]
MKRLNNFFDKLFETIPGGVFGLISVAIGICVDIIGIATFPEYNITTHSVSMLGIGPLGWFFNLGLIISGIIAVPFEISLGRSISRDFVNDKLIKIAVVISIISSFSLSLVGFFPANPGNYEIMVLHGLFSTISFIGGLVYCFMFGLFMFKDPKFSKSQAYLGFIVSGVFALFLFTLLPIVEWFAIFAIILWVVVNASYMLYKKI